LNVFPAGETGQTFTPIEGVTPTGNWNMMAPMGQQPANYADHRISMSAVMLDNMNGQNGFIMFDDLFSTYKPNQPAAPTPAGAPKTGFQSPPQYKNVFQ